MSDDQEPLVNSGAGTYRADILCDDGHQQEHMRTRLEQVVNTVYSGVAWIPPLVVLVVFGWSIYAYNVALCYETIVASSASTAFFFALVADVLVLLVLWAFATTVFSNAGHPPQRYKMTELKYNEMFPPQENASGTSPEQVRHVLGEDMVLIMRTHDGRPRYCVTCQAIKPDRTHHCSVCNRCILRMDHHCLFVANCVGYNNHKQFYLFVLHGTFYAMWVLVTSLPFVVEEWAHQGSSKFVNIHRLLLCVLATCFGGVLAIFTILHTRIILSNQTSVEGAGRLKNATRRWLYDVDRGFNWRSFMGNNPFMWFLPTATPMGDGYTFTRFAPDLDEI